MTYNLEVKQNGQSKDINLPPSVEWALDEYEIAAAERLHFNSYQRYFDKVGERYVVTDALMGSLLFTDDAANFDIVGAGTIHWARLEDTPALVTNRA